MSHRLSLLAPLALLIALVASACSGGGKSSPEATPPAESAAALPFVARQVSPTATTEGGPPDGVVTVTFSPPFVWPAAGPITSYMGPEHPEGIDIGLDAGGSKTILAAASGTVEFAGGGDDQPLGNSIVIDHGNGITTTYGHLSRLGVVEGQKVTIGEPIGVGGSTGIATGVHLHFEVRQDGQTVDPLDVLPTDQTAATTEAVDCATSHLVLPAGSEAVFDFSSLVGRNDHIVGVETRASAGSPVLEHDRKGDDVTVQTPVDFSGPDREDTYRLNVTVDNSSSNYTLSCPFAVAHHSVPTTFYVRAAPAEAGDTTADSPSPTPSPTPTPNPAANSAPHFDVPSFSGVDAQTPQFASPAGVSRTDQSPQYGVPTAQP